jgi:hypothetical protein
MIEFILRVVMANYYGLRATVVGARATLLGVLLYNLIITFKEACETTKIAMT